MKEKLLKTSSQNKFDTVSNGALFVAIGCAALLTLIVLGYLKFTGLEHKVVQRDAPANKMEIMIKEEIQAKLPAPKSKMFAPKLDEITGRWLVTFGKKSMAELVLVNQKFELIYTDDPQGRYRKYSKGDYKYDERNGKITLYPSKAAGMPKAIRGVKYKIMTLRHYDIFIYKKNDDHNLYFLAPEYQVISKSFHPLFLYADYMGAPVLTFSPVIAGKSK